MSKNPLLELHPLGQSVWYDNISRDILRNGDLKRLVDEMGVRGLTSNPSIFEKAIGSSATYDESIAALGGQDLSTDQVYEALAIEDIAEAADLLRPVYDSSGGEDGFVSIEVSPLLAADTEGSINEGLRLFEKLSRPNIMIKVPGTPEGLPAMEALLEKGVNVNVTLLFSVENYVAVAKSYCKALRARAGRGESVDKIRSVASFFVSRVDSAVDSRLDELAAQNSAKAESILALKGKFGVVNSKLAYQEFRNIFLGDDFSDLRDKGAAVQRPLWASTSTKNPEYRDVLYVEELIGAHTVNTMPHNTLEAFGDHGVAADKVETEVEAGRKLHAELLELGVDIEGILAHLQEDGVKKFTDSFVSLNKTIEQKLG